jgi:hypothetical protein
MKTYTKPVWVAIAGMLAGSVAVGLAGPASSTAKVTRYASPTGTQSPTCPKSHPCGIVSAINQAPADNEVIVEPGSYGSTVAPLTTALEPVSPGLYIHGEAGKPRPTIVSTAYGGAAAAVVVALGARLSDVQIEYSNPSSGSAVLVESGTADHVVAIATSVGSAACGLDTSLTDSECIDTGTDGLAIFGPVAGGTELATVRGVTAEATGMNGLGIRLFPFDSAYSVVATNSIIHGTLADVDEGEEQAGNADSITLSHCDYATVMSNHISSETVTADSTDIAKPPTFENAIVADFKELAGSVTVNKGAADPANDQDLQGNPRTLGSAPDIGAFELAQQPVSAKPKVTKKTKSSATLTVAVNPEGLPTTVRLVATHGHRQVMSSSVSARDGRKPHTVRLTIRRLAKHTKYTVVAVAKNAGGRVTSTKVVLTTRG